MSTSRVINRWLNRVYKSIAILLVLFAVLISALRLFLPYAHNYKDNLETFINSANNSQISIGELSMEWEKLGPSIVLNQVSLLETQSTDIFIDKIHVHLDFWQSLVSGRVITQDVTLNGAQFFIKSLNGSSNKVDKDEPLVTRITEIFLDQISRFSVLDSQVTFQNNQTEKVIVINQLDWLNDGDRHRGKGYIILDGLTSNNIKVLLDLHGDNIEDLDGQAYLQANQLNITPWLETILAIDNRDTHSAINFDGWLTIDKGLPSSLLISLGNNEISWTHNNTEQFFSINEGYVLADFNTNINNKNSFNTFNLLSSPLTIITPKNTWEPTSVQFSKTNGLYDGYISHLNVQGLVEVSPLFSNNKNFTELLTQVSPEGMIEDLFLQLSANKKSVIGNLKQVNTHPYNNIPGISNVEGEILFNNNVLRLKLEAQQGALDFAGYFVKPIPYNQLSTDSQLTFSEDSWAFTSHSFELISDEINLSAGLLIEKPRNEDVRMSLLASLGKSNAEFINHYFPHELMGDDLVNYLNGAIVKGQIDQAQVLFNGPLNKYPFEDNEGIFTVDVEISEAEFQFDPYWPSIENFNANLNFTNNSMLITARGGELENIDVQGTRVQIKDLKRTSILEVDTTFDEVDPQFISHLMEKSPLRKTVGETLKSLVIQKPISGELSLNLPLKNIDSTVAKGVVNFVNNTVNLQSPNMLFEHVNGQLTFNNDKVSTNDVTLLWRNMPLTLSVNSHNEGLLYNTYIAIDAEWDDKQWHQQLPKDLQTYGSGNLAWQGVFSLNSSKEGDFTYALDINSTLDKLSLDLPQPYRKKSGELLNLNTRVTGQNKQTTINASIGEAFKFYGVLDHEKITFTKALLALSSEEMLLPTQGFHISTQLEEADIEEWQPLIFNIIDSTKSEKEINLPNIAVNNTSKPKETALLESPDRIYGKVGTLLYKGYDLSDVNFNMNNNQQSWLLDINSKELRSQVTLHNNLLENGLEIDADFIHLAKIPLIQSLSGKTEAGNIAVKIADITSSELPKNSEDISENIIVKEDAVIKYSPVSEAEQQEISNFNQQMYTNLPPIIMHCESCTIDNIDLGEVNLKINRNSENNIVLEEFTASRNKSTLILDGVWSQVSGKNITNVQGSLDLKDLEQETESLGYTPTIKDSGLKSKFSFDWQASPYECSIEQLNGQINASLDDGYLAEVPDQARVFSVLSLQSLVRKLSFDFRDIFADGMFYQSINGDFQLKNGIVYTDNMFMKGAAGDLEVKGNTDLGQEKLDIRMSYKPNVTSSLPALAWIATLNPVTFLAGLALEEVITSKVYYEMNFELTGSLSQPIFKDVNRKTRNISVGKTTPPKIIDEIFPPNVISPITEEEAHSESQPIELPKKSEIDG